MKKDKKETNEPTIAPGMSDKQELNQDATKEEIEHHDFTEVTTLSLDEVNPS
ncbi:hypothetical protein [Metabacillus iocasae]|uniref:Uncharacterized protein n=1 Tax=Priestia iocasae TaxID=2291674 RepID=A0ABS2QRE9_9BACI|nr:hypothetical protein [Metabacillus iocasae]MBM7702030.1 hypothetical protein [Metabacillus iocasae]